ncbi:hypothetical protein Esti_003701 [Eimeria stiedai]
MSQTFKNLAPGASAWHASRWTGKGTTHTSRGPLSSGGPSRASQVQQEQHPQQQQKQQQQQQQRQRQQQLESGKLSRIGRVQQPAKMALFACCNCDPSAEEETQTQVQPCEEESREPNEDALMTTEQKQREKERLQALVKAFAKSAVVGAACEFVDVGARRRIPGVYYLDKSLTHFKITFSSSIEHFFPLKALHEVYSYSALLSSPATAYLARDPGIECLDTSARERLVMLEYAEPSKHQLNRLFLLESGGAEGRDRFVTCLKVLGLYAKSDSA